MHLKTKTFVMFVAANLVLSSLMVNLAQAGTFKRTRTMALTYAWGTCSMEEFNELEAMYPGYLPVADVTFYSNGTFDAFDNQSGASGGGIYNKQGKNLEITIVPPGPLGTVQYIGRKVAKDTYEGEIVVDGVQWGNWRGEF